MFGVESVLNDTTIWWFVAIAVAIIAAVLVLSPFLTRRRKRLNEEDKDKPPRPTNYEGPKKPPPFKATETFGSVDTASPQVAPAYRTREAPVIVRDPDDDSHPFDGTSLAVIAAAAISQNRDRVAEPPPPLESGGGGEFAGGGAQGAWDENQLRKEDAARPAEPDFPEARDMSNPDYVPVQAAEAVYQDDHAPEPSYEPPAPAPEPPPPPEPPAPAPSSD